MSPSSEPDPREFRTGLGLYTGHLLTVSGIALSNALLVFVLFWSFFSRRTLRVADTLSRSSASQLLLPLGCYALFSIASLTMSHDIRGSLPWLSELLTLTALPLGVLIVRGEKQVRLVVTLLMLLVTAHAVHGVWQYFSRGFGGLHERVPGLFSHYMTFSGILLLGFCIALSGTRFHSGRRRALDLAALSIIGVTLGLTLTRGAWIAALVAVGLALWLSARRYLVPALVGALVVVGLIAVLSSDFLPRVRSTFDLRNQSSYDRLCMIYAGGLMVRERPLLGLGPEMVAQLYPLYRHPTAPRVNIAHLHNTFLQMAAERGTLTVLCYLWLMATALRLALRSFVESRNRSASRADLDMLVVISVVAFNVAGLFEANWRDTEIQRLMLFLLAIPGCLDSRYPSGSSADT